MVAVVLLQPIRQIALRHVHAARIVVADIEGDEITPVTIIGNVMHNGRRREAVHYPKANAVMVKHRSQHAAYGALLTPNLDTHRLRFPKVPPILAASCPGKSGRIAPTRGAL